MPYIAPTPANLTARYPAFAGVSNAIVNMWLIEAATESLRVGDDLRARAEMAFAAHKMVETGAVDSAVPSGLQSFSSGPFSASISAESASRTGFKSTVYGREFLQYARRSGAGLPMMAWEPPTDVD